MMVSQFLFANELLFRITSPSRRIFVEVKVRSCVTRFQIRVTLIWHSSHTSSNFDEHSGGTGVALLLILVNSGVIFGAMTRVGMLSSLSVNKAFTTGEGRSEEWSVARGLTSTGAVSTASEASPNSDGPSKVELGGGAPNREELPTSTLVGGIKMESSLMGCTIAILALVGGVKP